MPVAEPSSGIQSRTVFQIGDLHFDDFVNAKFDVDDHKNRTPSGITAGIALRLSKTIADNLGHRLAQNPDALIAFCGDFTSRGNQVVFQEAIDYLGDFFKAAAGTDFTEKQVHLVPGNHDVDRKGSMKFVDLGVERFRPLAQIVAASSIPAPLTLTTRATELAIGRSSILFCSVNSCRASGSFRQAPELEVKDPIIDAIAESVGIARKKIVAQLKAAIVDNVKLDQEALDIPFITGEDLVGISNAVSATKSTYTLPLILAHHGFLPQSTPRLDTYTEMVNGGEVRQVLASFDRPVVYLHGHIHEDTVEILRSGGPNRQSTSSLPPVVVISAPEFKEGYNEIVIEFGKSGMPLGLSLIRHRVAKGVITKSQPERISLSSRALVDDRFKHIIQELHKRTMAKGSQILDWRDQGPAKSKTLSDEDVEECIETLCWQGLVDPHSDRSKPFEDREYTFK